MNHLTDAGLKLIMAFESFRSLPYPDAGGVWTNGYGNTDGVHAATPAITEGEARRLLLLTLSSIAQDVENSIRMPLNDNQFSALLSLCYNVGLRPLSAGLGQALNRGDYLSASNHFLLWDEVRIGGILTPLPGLLRRRKAERDLFLYIP